ncbi:MAG: glycosyltransferase [Deltaproteobacteria bacterium]|nr:glycosyltransferase [Desulfitobacteriaceae bacterium]MDI6855022.1 glycosyltransferase [Deltaproteobacteria bacterium]
MRIGLLLPKLQVGGAEQVVLNLAREYLKKGQEVEVMAFASGGSMAPRFKESCIPISEFDLQRTFHPTPSWWLSVLRARRILIQKLRLKRLDVLHTHLMGPDLDALVAGRQAGIKVIVHTIHNTYTQFSDGSLLQKVRNFTRKRRWRKYDRLFAVDEQVRDWAVQYRMVQKENIVVIQNGIDMSYLEVHETREGIRKDLGWGEDDIILLNIGSLTKQKNHRILLDALAILKKNRRSLKLAVAGGGPLEKDLKSATKELDLQNRVSFLGIRGDVPRLLKAADIFILSSLWEGLPIALLEAMAAGIPVIASDLPVHRRILKGGLLGTLCPATPEGLAKAIGIVIEEREYAMHRAALAREELRLRYDAGRMAEEYLSQYYELASGKKSNEHFSF